MAAESDRELATKLAAALSATGLEQTPERIAALLPAYRAQQAGIDRLRALNLEATDPAVVFQPALPG